MKASVCITVFNEESSIGKLIESLLWQSLKPKEIIIVDGGSNDKTVSIIRHWQKKDKRIRLLIKKCSRSEGRNLSIDLANSEIIAVTDAGCIPKKNWLEILIRQFKNEKVEMVAGFYFMTGNSPIQKAFSVFLGVNENDFDKTFLPSTRSVAFKKRLWEQLGGFPESMDDTAEDTVFNIKALDYGVKMAHEKEALVEWGMPKTIIEGVKKMHLYAKGDIKSKVWKHPTKGYASHNMRVISILIRYFLGLMLIILSLIYLPLLYVVVALICVYIIWIVRKVYIITRNMHAAFWGIIIQFASDVYIMIAFFEGIKR